ncbi:MAG: Fe-S cluster assembly protein SufB [Gammaproteobacteria bacterium]|nr:MAG: Fe-S cluster assembly protein SufB [Gammaproteobacteria bacterium]
MHEHLDKHKQYREGFFTDVESLTLAPGLSEEKVRFISESKGEPEWLTEWRLSAYRAWLKMEEPEWGLLDYKKPDYDKISYYSIPKCSGEHHADTSSDLPAEIRDTYKKLGVKIDEQETLEGGVAVDAVFDSASVITTYRKKLAEQGIVFCPFTEAVHTHGDLIKKYLGSVVAIDDNFFSALNSAVFAAGTFVYIPKGVHCPMDLSTYFRINHDSTGQFERTLIIADEGSYVGYLEGCTAPIRNENQLHAAVVEIVALDNAEIKYSTVQNWYPGDEHGKGGIFNFVTKRGMAFNNAKISWAQVETGAAITWKYPSCVLVGDNSIGEFYSVALTKHKQQADTGTKMIHIGKNSRSTIISKGISTAKSQNTYRGLVKMTKNAKNARNYTQCDSLLIGDRCGAHTFPYIDSHNSSATVEHEATTSKVSDDQLFLCLQRGIEPEKAVSMIVNGFCKEVFQQLPHEFSVEAAELLEVSLEGSVG